MEKEITLDEKLLRQMRIPTLCLDEKWLEIMEPLMNEELRILMARQCALIEEEKTAGHHLVELKRQKRSTLSQLLGLSERLQKNDAEAEAQAERLKALLELINDEMDMVQFKAETAPAEIKKLNVELLEESIPLGYHRLLKDRERMDDLELKIQKLRSELLMFNDEKFLLEDQVTVMQQYLHALLGKELSDELDAHYMKNSEEPVR